MTGMRWPMAALVPLATGALWLLGPADQGIFSFLLSIVPGALLLVGGAGAFALPQDPRTSQLAALGGALGTAVGVLALLYAGLGMGLLLMLGSAASFVAAGWVALVGERRYEQVPEPPLTLPMAARVAVDEAVLGLQPLVGPTPGRAEQVVSSEEVLRAVDLFRERGWLDKPEGYHAPPPSLGDPDVRPERWRGHHYDHVSFESGYEPPEGSPGRERWLDYRPNRTAHARVLRHGGEPRPWLVCIHGAGAGTPGADLTAFGRMHRDLGLNLVLPVLPLHGPRRIGRTSGFEFVGSYALNTVHAMAQAVWDLRRLLTWVRAQDAPAVGVFGLSLGGYTAALLACLDDGLACAIPGIPATDFARVNRRSATPLRLIEAQSSGALGVQLSEVYRVVSPLALAPLVAHERRLIFGATADRFVPPDQVRDLWLHWERPRIEWYHGSHLSVVWDPELRRLLREFLTETLLRS